MRRFFYWVSLRWDTWRKPVMVMTYSEQHRGYGVTWRKREYRGEPETRIIGGPHGEKSAT